MSKSETITKILISNDKNPGIYVPTEQDTGSSAWFRVWDFEHYYLFRVSCFEFRIFF